MSDHRFRIIQSAAGIGLLSLASPVTGFVVEVCLARLAGFSPLIDAYRATSTVLNLGVKIFFGAATIEALVPLLCGYNLKARFAEGRRTALLFGTFFP